MIEEAEFNAELQDAISRAYSGLNDRDRALVDSQAARLTLIPGIDMRDARYLLAMLAKGDDICAVLRKTTEAE